VTPASVLAEIPADLLRRHNNPSNQLYAAKRLAQWLDDRGCRPTWLEIEHERARRSQ
jgi:hypothetical protein